MVKFLGIGTCRGQYPSGAIIERVGELFCGQLFPDSDQWAIVLLSLDGPAFILDPRAVVTIDGKLAYSPRQYLDCLPNEMVTWLHENPKWDAP
jgi:hypothetical protein